MLEEMPASMFTEWLGYWQLEPWGEGEEWLREGQTDALLANIYRDRKKRPNPYHADDFIPDREAAFRKSLIPQKERDKEIMRGLEMWWVATGKQIKTQ